jgi:ATP-dependent RNA helicase DBP3
MQTQTNLGHISETLGLGIVCLYGGASKQEQVRLLQKRPRIVVGTPGRLLDLASEGSLDLSNVQWLVLDEADRMLDKGFENDIRNIISQCKPSAAGSEGRITSMFSATWPVSVRRLANDFMVDPIRIIVGSDELSANTSVKQSVIVLQDGRQKDGKLLDVMRAEGYPSPRYGKQPTGKGAQREKVLVFALYKKEAARVATWLERQGYEVGCIQGDLSQDKRTKALEDFRQGITGVLVATDVAARGLDIPKVELVGASFLTAVRWSPTDSLLAVNYTFPLLVEDYVHRIGRTGRAGREGRSVTFFTDDEKHLAGELQRVLRDAGQDVPEALAAFGGTIKKKAHAAYGDHYREIDPNIKAKKITFD